MTTLTFGPGGFLQYNAHYCLLICKECQYAIQKSALESHLLRHRIYRGERQVLLSALAELRILEPHEVPLPDGDAQAVNALPVLSGFRCEMKGCNHLTASSKRMKSHWTEVHGSARATPDFDSIARPVKLQTFFRGTKVRYFEVILPTRGSSAYSENDDSGHERTSRELDDSDTGVVGPAPRSAQTRVAAPPASSATMDASVKSSVLSAPSAPPTLVPQASPVSVPRFAPNAAFGNPSLDLNLETLAYFHHFITSTSSTLPAPSSFESARQYWQSDVIPRALNQPRLMSGLLALSVCHSAIGTDDPATREKHRKREPRFALQFLSGPELSIAENAKPGLTENENSTHQLVKQLTCLLRLSESALAVATLNDDLLTEVQLSALLNTVRGVVDTGRPPEDTQSTQRFGELAQGPTLRSAKVPSPALPRVPSGDRTPSVLLDQLYVLPHRIGDALGKPRSLEEVYALLSAITAVVECCEISFADNGVETAWRGVETWLRRLPDQYLAMISQNQPSALVVLAYWAVLVKRAEHLGCWLLKGLAKIIMSKIKRQLVLNGPNALILVETLMGIVDS